VTFNAAMGFKENDSLTKPKQGVCSNDAETIRFVYQPTNIIDSSVNLNQIHMGSSSSFFLGCMGPRLFVYLIF
jgi:hypothetical protein